MKNILFALLFLCIAGLSFAQSYTPADAGSKVHFVIKNFGIKTGGDFTGLKGTVEFNPKSLSACKFNVSVDAATVDTDNSSRDNHLRKEEYFDVAKYPQLSFTSTRVTASTLAGRFYVFGNLTIKDITKPVEFGFSATPTANGYIFTGEFTIDRRDFGVGGNSFSLSDGVKVVLTIAANK